MVCCHYPPKKKNHLLFYFFVFERFLKSFKTLKMGGSRCCFRKCPVATERNKGMHFFKFPGKDKERFKIWLQFAGLNPDLTQKETFNKVICARHFPETHFMNYKRNSLTKSATPCLTRLNETMAIDFGKGNPTLIQLPPISKSHLIAPEGFGDTMNFIEADRKLAEDLINDFEQHGTSQILKVITAPKRISNSVNVEQKAKKIKMDEIYKPLAQDCIVLSTENEFCMRENSSTRNDVGFDPKTLLISVEKGEVEKISENNKNSIEIIQQDIISNAEQFVIGKSKPTQDIKRENYTQVKNMESKLKLRTKEVKEAKEKQVKSEQTLSNLRLQVNNLADDNKGLQSVLTSTNQQLLKNEFMLTKYEESPWKVKSQTKIRNEEYLNLEQDIQSEEQDHEKMDREMQRLRIAYERLNKQYSHLKKENEDLTKELKQVQEYSSSLAEQKTNTCQLQSNQQLSKVQLFNGLKKYLSQTMIALLRLQLSGCTDRIWKPDEKRLAIDLMDLGDYVYNYFVDEWLIRLPPLKQVKLWKNENLNLDEEDL